MDEFYGMCMANAHKNESNLSCDEPTFLHANALVVLSTFNFN